MSTSKLSNPKDLVGVLKVPMSTVSAPVLAEISLGMLEGACKYGRHNYRMVGVRSSVYYDATMRHLMAWWEGQDIDPASGLHHVTKAITWDPIKLLFIDLQAAAVIKKHEKLSPRHYTLKDKISGLKA